MVRPPAACQESSFDGSKRKQQCHPLIAVELLKKGTAPLRQRASKSRSNSGDFLWLLSSSAKACWRIPWHRSASSPRRRRAVIYHLRAVIYDVNSVTRLKQAIRVSFGCSFVVSTRAQSWILASFGMKRRDLFGAMVMEPIAQKQHLRSRENQQISPNSSKQILIHECSMYTLIYRVCICIYVSL